MRLLYWKVCLFLSFASIEDIIESTSAMFALHSSRGQFKLPIVPWIVNKTTPTPCVLAGTKVTSFFHFVASYHKTVQAGNVCSLYQAFGFGLASHHTVWVIFAVMVLFMHISHFWYAFLGNYLIYLWCFLSIQGLFFAFLCKLHSPTGHCINCRIPTFSGTPILS